MKITIGVIKGYLEVNDSDSDLLFRRTLLGYYAMMWRTRHILEKYGPKDKGMQGIM